MEGFEIKNGFIDLSSVEFDCPKCFKRYSDIDDKFLKRCDKNKSGCTRVNCECGYRFNVTYNYRSEIVVFNSKN